MSWPAHDALPAPCRSPAALPLLQPQLRRLAKGPLQAAAKALEALGSPLGRLRAQLHLEAARCEAAEDALVKVGPPPCALPGSRGGLAGQHSPPCHLARPLHSWSGPRRTGAGPWAPSRSPRSPRSQPRCLRPAGPG
jgi:hypothetical protein